MKSSRFVKPCIILAMTGLALSSAVFAQDTASIDVKNSPLYFPNVDKNGDGAISRSEVPAQLHDLRVHFDQYDVNKDHRLDQAEYLAYLQTLAQGACRENQHTEAKCANSPNSMGSPTMGVSDVKRPPAPQPKK